MLTLLMVIGLLGAYCKILDWTDDRPGWRRVGHLGLLTGLFCICGEQLIFAGEIGGHLMLHLLMAIPLWVYVLVALLAWSNSDNELDRYMD